MKVKLKESFNLLLMKIYPDFSEINQIKICLSSINHEDEQISLLYIKNRIILLFLDFKIGNGRQPIRLIDNMR
jgi:hypothetical protein